MLFQEGKKYQALHSGFCATGVEITQFLLIQYVLASAKAVIEQAEVWFPIFIEYIMSRYR